MTNQVFGFRSQLLSGLIRSSILALGIGFSSTASSAQLPQAGPGSAEATAHGTAVQPVMALAHSGYGRQNMQKHHGQGRGAGHGKAGRYRGHHRLMAMFHGLGLSEEQRDKLFALHHASAPMMRNLAKERRAARKDLGKLIKADQFSQASVDAVAVRVGQASSKMAVMRAKLMFDMRAVLTKEQRADLDQHMPARKHRKRGQHGESKGCANR